MKQLTSYALSLLLVFGQSVAVADYRLTLPKPGLSGPAQNPAPPGGDPAPSIGSVSPTQGVTSGGTTVVVLGSNFQTGATVTVGGAAATITETTPTSLSLVTPAHAAGSVSLVVTNPDAQTATVGFLYVNPPPTIASVTPNQGSVSGGTAVTVSGSGFLGGIALEFGGVAATGVTLTSGTSLTAVSPPHSAGVKDVRVVNTDLQEATLGAAFTYDYPPVISSLSANKSPLTGGQSITITGYNFLSGATVTFGGVAATSVTYASMTSLTAVTPAHAAGPVDVVVTNPNGISATLAAGVTYADWTLAFTSRRSTDYQPGTTAGSTTNNPHASNGYSGVWEYLSLSGNGLNQVNPWWASIANKLVWDDSWFGNAGQWAFSNDVSPNIYNGGMQHNLGSATVSRMPAVAWRNPFNETIQVTVRGSLYVLWDGTSGAHTAPIEVAIAKVPATGAVSLLLTHTYNKPNNTAVAEVANLGGINIPGITLAPGDSIRITLRTQSGSGSYYNTLVDQNLFIDAYRLQ